MRTVSLLPTVVPAVVLSVGMQLMFAQYELADTYIGVIVAHSVLAVPFVIVNVTASLQRIDTGLEHAAVSMGAAPSIALRTVTLPLAAPGIVSGALFAFATSLEEVVLTLFVAEPNQRTLGRQMFSIIRENISAAIAAAAFISIAGTVVIASLMNLGRRRMRCV
jgi:putative spermidine/putrescine transport system permease protein